MKLWQAKAHAAKLWPQVPLEFHRNWRWQGRVDIPCVILLEGKVLGAGRGWQEAMRDAAIRWNVVASQAEAPPGEELLAVANALRPPAEVAKEIAAASREVDAALSKAWWEQP